MEINVKLFMHHVHGNLIEMALSGFNFNKALFHWRYTHPSGIDLIRPEKYNLFSYTYRVCPQDTACFSLWISSVILRYHFKKMSIIYLTCLFLANQIASNNFTDQSHCFI